jgi:hypothetical protein
MTDWLENAVPVEDAPQEPAWLRDAIPLPQSSSEPAWLKNAVPVGSAEEPTSEMESMGLGALQGVTFNFADEVEGFLRSLPPGTTYEEAVKKVRERYKKAEEANPGFYRSGELGGALLSALVPGVGAIGGGGKGIAALAKGGAIQGALSGLGEGEGLSDMAEKAIEGGVGGALIGGTLGAAGKGLGKVFGKKSSISSAPMEETLVREAEKDIVTPVEEAYKPFFEHQDKFASALYNDKVDPAAVSDAVKKDLLRFADSIGPTPEGRGGARLESALDIIRDTKSRLSEKDFKEIYHNFAKARIAEKEIKNTFLPGDPLQKDALFSKIGDFFSDSLGVLKKIDEGANTSLYQNALAIGKGLNKATWDLRNFMKKAQKPIEMTEESTSPILAEALKTGDFSKLPPSEKKAAEAWREFYDATLKYAQDNGLPITKRENYIPKKMKAAPEVAANIELLVKEAGGLEAAAKNPPKDLVDAILYMGGSLPKNPREAKAVIAAAMNPSSSIYKSERMASALFSREEKEMPAFLEEMDLRRLAYLHMMDLTKYVNTKNAMRAIAKDRDLLKISGADAAANFVDELMKSSLGKKTGLDALISDGINTMQKNAYVKLAEETNPVKKYFYKQVAEKPDSLKNLVMNVYPNYLLGPKQALQNMASGYLTAMPELGWLSGTKEFLGAVKDAAVNYKKLGSAYLDGLEKGGVTSASYSDYIDSFHKSKPGALSKGADKMAGFAMTLFKTSENMNRAIMHELGKRAAQSPEMTARLLKTMPPAMQKVVASAQPELKASLIGKYLQDRALFSYNNFSKSEAARALGPYFSMFTKYPSVAIARVREPFIQNKDTREAVADLTKRMLLPYLMTSAANQLLFEDTPHPLGGGIAGSTLAGAIPGVLGGRITQTPVAQTLGNALDLSKAIVEGDPDELEKAGGALGRQAAGFLPGGAYGWWKAGNDLYDFME